MYESDHAAYQQRPRQSAGILRTLLSVIGLVAMVLVLSWGLRTFIFQAYEIPSGSMEETISTLPMETMAKMAPPFMSHLKIPKEFPIT